MSLNRFSMRSTVKNVLCLCLLSVGSLFFTNLAHAQDNPLLPSLDDEENIVMPKSRVKSTKDKYIMAFNYDTFQKNLGDVGVKSRPSGFGFTGYYIQNLGKSPLDLAVGLVGPLAAVVEAVLAELEAGRTIISPTG